MLQIYKIKTICRHFLKNFLTIFGDPILFFGKHKHKHLYMTNLHTKYFSKDKWHRESIPQAPSRGAVGEW